MWGSSRQACVALSTTESDILACSNQLAATKAAQTAIWLRLVETELETKEQETTVPAVSTLPSVPLYCDNQSAIRLVKKC